MPGETSLYNFDTKKSNYNYTMHKLADSMLQWSSMATLFYKYVFKKKQNTTANKNESNLQKHSINPS
jgi:hypothetical protein